MALAAVLNFGLAINVLADDIAPPPGLPVNLLPALKKPGKPKIKRVMVPKLKLLKPETQKPNPPSAISGMTPGGSIIVAKTGHELGFLPPALASAVPEKLPAMADAGKPAASDRVKADASAASAPGTADKPGAIIPVHALAQGYCTSFASAASEARYAWQIQQLNDLDTQVKQHIADLDSKRAEYQRWLDRQDEARRKADDSIVAIFSRMRPEAASLQLAAMDEFGAAAIIGKLNPRTASLFLNEMGAVKAARLTELLSGQVKTVAN